MRHRRLWKKPNYGALIKGCGCMQLRKYLIKNFVLPVISRKMLKWLNFYEKSQWWRPAKLRALQENKLRKMMNYVYNNVPYYRKVFKHKNLRPEDIKNTEDLEKIPVLSHEDVRQNAVDLISVDKSIGSLLRCQTTGTTGHPLVLYKDKNELGSGIACLFRGWGWCGYQIGDKRALVWGRRLVTSKYASMKANLLNSLKRTILLGAWNLGEEKIEYFVKRLNAAKPTFLSGYVSPINLLANFINQKGVDLDFNLKGISTTAEPLLGFHRREIEKAFRCEVFDQYGSGEVNSLGFECEEHMGLHVPIERVHIEFLDEEDDSPVSVGEKGRIVVTCLENYGMPLIRYDTEDLGVGREGSCSCGRKLPLMDSIIGRRIDLIRLPNGNVIYGGLFAIALQDLEWTTKYGLTQFQLVQKKLDYIVLKIQTQKKPSQQALKLFKGLMKEHLGDVALDIDIVDQIPVLAFDKRRYIISEVNRQSS